jgi:PKD repeat protein
VAAPFADFCAVPTSGNVPLAVQFTDDSTGTVYEYTWDFGDGNYSTNSAGKWSFGDGTYSTVRNPVHIYTKDGKYTVAFTAKILTSVYFWEL